MLSVCNCTSLLIAQVAKAEKQRLPNGIGGVEIALTWWWNHRCHCGHWERKWQTGEFVFDIVWEKTWGSAEVTGLGSEWSCSEWKCSPTFKTAQQTPSQSRIAIFLYFKFILISYFLYIIELNNWNSGQGFRSKVAAPFYRTELILRTCIVTSPRLPY